MYRGLYKTIFLLAISLFVFLAANSIFAQGMPVEGEGEMEEAPYLSPPPDSPTLPADNEENKKQQLDYKYYMETMGALTNASDEEKIKGWEQFLEDHPETIYKSEIKDNISTLRAKTRAQEEDRLARELKEKQDYEAFKAQTAVLPLGDQIAKYEEYINKHPGNSAIPMATADLNGAKDLLAKSQPAQSAPAAAAAQQPAVATGTLTTPGVTKDPSHALFLASVPGIFVPGIGTFYAGDVPTGVIIVVMRAAAIGMGTLGAVRDSRGLLITGILTYGVSYLIDVIAAPSLAREYNEKLDKKAAYSVVPFVTVADNKPYLGVSFGF